MQKNEICASSSKILRNLCIYKVFGNTPDFWLNVHCRNDLWEAVHTPRRMARVERAGPFREVTA